MHPLRLGRAGKHRHWSLAVGLDALCMGLGALAGIGALCGGALLSLFRCDQSFRLPNNYDERLGRVWRGSYSFALGGFRWSRTLRGLRNVLV